MPPPCLQGTGDSSRMACETAAFDLGKQPGGCGGFPFVGAYSTKGCFSYTSGPYANCLYYGTVGGADVSTAAELNAVSGVKYRPEGYPACGYTCDMVTLRMDAKAILNKWCYELPSDVMDGCTSY